MAKTGKIHHPTDGYELKLIHFAASGTAQNVLRVKGTLIDQTTNQRFPGKTLLDPIDSDSGEFWIIQFDQDISTEDYYTLEVRDADDKTLLDKSANIHVKESFGIVIGFPQPGDTINCGEFASYGTTSSTGGTMQGSLSCAQTAQITQSSGPPDWVLYIVSNAAPGNCTLTVSQPQGNPVPTPQSVKFICGRT
jgi:hypothetical protein